MITVTNFRPHVLFEQLHEKRKEKTKNVPTRSATDDPARMTMFGVQAPLVRIIRRRAKGKEIPV